MRTLDGTQSALNPQGPGAAAVAELTWVLTIGSTLVFVLVMGLTAAAVWGRPRWLATQKVVVAGGVAFPLVVLTVLLVYSLMRAADAARGPADVRIELIGYQWWWQVRYLDEKGKPDFETANEIRIPVNASVEIALRSADVLHSFWVPALAGKLDMIPGKDNRIRFSASRAGTWRGQCAEYCGGPHALMALFVVAQDPNEYAKWKEAQRQPASASNEVFMSHCASCHTVRGTDAKGLLGPDLTHVGSRVSLGAGILPNNRAALADWITSSQHIKPGNLMPGFADFSREQLQSLSAYLEGLK